MRKNILLALALLVLAVPMWAQTEDIVDRLDKALGVTLPDGYRQKVKDFAATNTVMKDKDAAQFTEQFILEEMKKDWKISRQNQLLFIWHSIYYQITDSNLYDGGGTDDNEKRIEEFNSKGVSIRIRASGSKYKLSCITYMEELSAEADRRSAEADRRSAEAKQLSAVVLYSSLRNLAWFYNRYKSDPSTITNEEVKRFKEDGIRVIQRCKEENIDYLSLLPTEALEFYEIHPVGNQRNNITYTQAMVQLLNRSLKEVVKLYNINRQAPRVEWINDIIKDCKKYNVDYRAILLKELGDKKKVDELLKFYGVE
ncbi:MAG: hypothetical protein IK010_01970 [Bacteroidales bacterium]|nr:hypothetical protein [Bacteroidales bacterium]